MADAIRSIKERISGAERLSDELYAEIAERFDVTEREVQREWVRDLTLLEQAPPA
jgi:hypothetical protein